MVLEGGDVGLSGNDVETGEGALEPLPPRKKLLTSTLGFPRVDGVVVAELVLEDGVEADRAAEVVGIGFPLAGVPAAIEPNDCTGRPSVLIAGTSAGDEDNGADWSFTDPKVITPPVELGK